MPTLGNKGYPTRGIARQRNLIGRSTRSPENFDGRPRRLKIRPRKAG